MTAQRRPLTGLMTVDEFFAWDGGGQVGKLELIGGVVRAMAPASADHSFIQLTIASAIKNHLRRVGSRCRAGTEAPIVPPLHQKKNARVPDIAVTCAPPSDSKVFEDPILIVEILSPSNEDATWDSINALAGLSSLREILVVWSTKVEAEVYTRDASGAWPRDPVRISAGGIIQLSCMTFEMPMAEVYEGTILEPLS